MRHSMRTRMQQSSKDAKDAAPQLDTQPRGFGSLRSAIETAGESTNKKVGFPRLFQLFIRVQTNQFRTFLPTSLRTNPFKNKSPYQQFYQTLRTVRSSYLNTLADQNLTNKIPPFFVGAQVVEPPASYFLAWQIRL